MSPDLQREFEYWYAHGQSMKNTAEHYGVNVRTIRRHASRGEWVDLAADRDRKIAKQLQKDGEESAIVNAQEYLQMASEYVRRTHQRFLEGNIQPKSVNDLWRIEQIYADAMRLADGGAGEEEESNLHALLDAIRGSAFESVEDPDKEEKPDG